MKPTQEDYQNFLRACSSGALDEVKKCVIIAGCDVNYITHDGWTPLGRAAQNGSTAVVHYLVEKGARADMPSYHSRMPYEWASENQQSCAEFLKDRYDRLQALNTPEWSLFGKTQLAHVVYSPALNRRVTEIFNFESRERLTISENLKPHTETVLPVTSFDDINETTLHAALDQFTKLGGKADENFVLQAQTRLNKKNHLSGNTP